jgi:SAM-dependent methyltransferase
MEGAVETRTNERNDGGMSYSNPAAYDQFMGRWSARLAPLFAHFVGVRDGQCILDVGCGTGSLSRTLLAAGKKITITGVDPAQDYVSFVRRAIPDSRANFQVSTAESLPFPDESFDAAIALLVLQEFDDPGRAVREMVRTTRSKGSVAGCLWDFQDGMPMLSLFWQAAETVAPAAVARRRSERPPSQLGLPALVGLWDAAGLTDVRITSLELRQQFTSFEDFWLPFLAESTPVSQFAIGVNRETGGELAQALHRLMPSVEPDGSFDLPARALAITGTALH